MDSSLSKEEYDSYLNKSPSSGRNGKSGLFEYWKGQRQRYPLLAILARRYLAIPATSAAAESVVSLGSNVITKGRTSLDPVVAKQLIMLKSWQIRGSEQLEELDQVDEDESDA